MPRYRHYTYMHTPIFDTSLPLPIRHIFAATPLITPAIREIYIIIYHATCHIHATPYAEPLRYIDAITPRHAYCHYQLLRVAAATHCRRYMLVVYCYGYCHYATQEKIHSDIIATWYTPLPPITTHTLIFTTAHYTQYYIVILILAATASWYAILQPLYCRRTAVPPRWWHDTHNIITCHITSSITAGWIPPLASRHIEGHVIDADALRCRWQVTPLSAYRYTALLAATPAARSLMPDDCRQLRWCLCHFTAAATQPRP